MSRLLNLWQIHRIFSLRKKLLGDYCIFILSYIVGSFDDEFSEQFVRCLLDVVKFLESINDCGSIQNMVFSLASVCDKSLLSIWKRKLHWDIIGTVLMILQNQNIVIESLEFITTLLNTFNEEDNLDYVKPVLVFLLNGGGIAKESINQRNLLVVQFLKKFSKFDGLKSKSHFLEILELVGM